VLERTQGQVQKLSHKKIKAHTSGADKYERSFASTVMICSIVPEYASLLRVILLCLPVLRLEEEAMKRYGGLLSSRL